MYQFTLDEDQWGQDWSYILSLARQPGIVSISYVSISCIFITLLALCTFFEKTRLESEMMGLVLNINCSGMFQYIIWVDVVDCIGRFSSGADTHIRSSTYITTSYYCLWCEICQKLPW